LEIDWRKAAGEYLRCAWASDRKGNHRVKDFIRPITMDKRTASYPEAKKYQKMKVANMELSSRDEDSSDSESGSSDGESDSEGSEENEEESAGEYFDKEEKEQQEAQEERDWWHSPSDLDVNYKPH
jgi:hypothetical protein